MITIDVFGIKEVLATGHRASDVLRDVLLEVKEMYCPSASGFEGPETFPDCGECIVCVAKELFKNSDT